MTNQKSIYVIGSSNTDMVIKSDTLPLPGETVIGGDFLMNPGGKGANQAVSCARLNGKVIFISRVGNDLFGKQSLEHYQKQDIDIQFITTDQTLPSGIALINVDKQGENCITVAPGANNTLQFVHISQAFTTLQPKDIVLIQLEIPFETVLQAIQQAHAKGARVILNPAPATNLPDWLYQHLYLITPNETEATLLTGAKVTDETTAFLAAEQLVQKGCENVIITLGSKGSFLKTQTFSGLIPAQKVKAVDTTAAGDCFNGALAVAIAENKSLLEAVSFANKAAAISVTRLGAQSSLPKRIEIPE
jgi:ribokinase